MRMVHRRPSRPRPGGSSARSPQRIEPRPLRLVVSVHPDGLLSAEEFARGPRPAVAIEAVADLPGWSPNLFSFDHHVLVPRPFCDSACKQVLVALDNDLVAHLTAGMEGSPVHVQLAGVDEDVILCMALLEEPSLAANPGVRRLVHLEDELDRSGGTGCADATPDELGRIAWINEPLHRRRAAGASMDAAESLAVLAQCVARVGELAQGRARSVSADSSIDVVACHGSIALIRESGPYARLQLRPAGIDAYVSTRSRGGARIVTVGLTGAFVPVDLLAVYDELNRLEGPGPSAWGGSTHVGGSPFTGTHLDPEQILGVMVRHDRRRGASGPS